jgi:ATP phosphoribosyltransferase regulatory subunit
MDHAKVSEELEEQLFNALQHKDVPTLSQLVSDLPKDTQAAVLALAQLSGGIEVIARAKSVLPNLPEIVAALNELEQAANQLKTLAGNVGIDLAELR